MHAHLHAVVFKLWALSIILHAFICIHELTCKFLYPWASGDRAECLSRIQPYTNRHTKLCMYIKSEILSTVSTSKENLPRARLFALKVFISSSLHLGFNDFPFEASISQAQLSRWGREKPSGELRCAEGHVVQHLPVKSLGTDCSGALPDFLALRELQTLQ